MKKVHILYVFNCYISKALLAINPELDDETAIKAIFDKIKENEINDIDEDEYEEITNDEELMSYARRIWLYHDSIYIDTRWEATYGIATNVELLS